MADDIQWVFDFMDKSGDYLDKLEECSIKAAEKIGKERVEIINANTPKSNVKAKKSKYGKLAKHNTMKIIKGIHEITLDIGSTDFRAKFFVYGTNKMAKRDYISPALDGLEKAFESELVKLANEIKDLC